MSKHRIFIAMCCAAVLAGCSITSTIRSVAGEPITMVCIRQNPAVHMAGFLPELQSQIEGLGIKTRVFEGEPPAGCKYLLEYVANWQWDLAMYLSFAELRVYRDRNLIGEAVYNARHGGARLDKFGPTSSKLKGLTEELFRGAGARAGNAAATGLTGSPAGNTR